MEKVSKKILIVEDEKPMARALELKLTKAGFGATAVFDGQSALDVLAKEKFDLILTDLMMPKMDGFKLMAELKAKNINIPVITLSNLSQEEDRKKSKAMGAIDYFVKSDTPIADIVAYVKKFLKI